MIKPDPAICQAAFDANWYDWCLGGPRPDGYTRAGESVEHRPIQLTGYREQMISVDDVLSKNRQEVERWHLDFLNASVPASQTQYYQEYLLSRYEEHDALQRVAQFRLLFQNIAKQGVLKRIWVAETDLVECFRFDGCHRTCCAIKCGHSVVPALVFSAKYV